MTDLDVALRVRLAYEPAAAKKAVADLDAIRAAGAKLGSQVGPSVAARGLGDLGRAAAVSKVGVDELAHAGARFGDTTLATRALTGDLRGAEAAAISASRAVEAVGAVEPTRPLTLEEEVAALVANPGAPPPRRSQRSPAAEAPATPEPPIAPEVSPAPAPSPRPARVAPPETVVVRPVPAAAPATVTAPAPAPSGDAYREAKAEAHIAAMWPPAANPNHPAFARAAKVAGPARGTAEEQRAVEALGHAADKLATVAGPNKLAAAVAAVTPAATEARRHVDDVADAAQHAQRAVEGMARTVRAAGGGKVGGGNDAHGTAGGGKSGDGAGGRSHSGPSGLRGALIAGARPLHMERLVMSAMTPTGLAGLGAGLGAAELVHGLKAAAGEAIDFERAMVDVKRAAGDMPAEGIDRLGRSILDVSRATGAAKGDLAALTAAALRTGQPLADLPRQLDFSAKAANAMGMKVDEAGARLMEVRRAWGKTEAGAEDVFNAAALAGEKTGANPASLVDAATRHSDLRAFHMSARQIVGMQAGFQGSGLDPSQADATFTNLSDKLLHPENNKDFGKELFRLGIGPEQARLNMRADPTRTMFDVLDKLKARPEGERANIMERAFGPDAARDMTRIVDHLDQVRKAVGLVENEAQRNAAVERLFQVFDATTAAKLDKAGAALGGFAVKVGRAFTPIIGAAADVTARLVNGLGDMAEAHPHAAAGIGIGVAGAGAAAAGYAGKQMLGGFGLGAAATELTGAAAALDAAALKLGAAGAAGGTASTVKGVAEAAAPGVGLVSKLATAVPIIGAGAFVAETMLNRDQSKSLVDGGRPDTQPWDSNLGLPGFADGGPIHPGAVPGRLVHRGTVTGPGGPREDKVPAWLSAGEFVVRASEAERHHGLLIAINEGRIPAFADGGPVRLAGTASPIALDRSMPVRALQRGIERNGDAEGMARLLAKLGPEAHGKPLTVEQIKAAIGEGTKAGVVAGMREAMDMGGGRAAAGGIVRGGDDAGGSSSDGGEGSGKPLENPSLRYGGGFGPGGRRDADGSVHHRSIRFHGGYGPRAASGVAKASPGRQISHDRPLDPDRLREQARHHGRARQHEDTTPADDGRPRPPMPGGGEGRADPASLKGLLFKGESGGNPGIYNHRVGGRYLTGHLDPNTTTVAELQRRQKAGEVFAAGKYQIIPKTMQGAVKALGLKGDEKFDSALQDRIYTDYLAGSKRPAISAYVTGKSDDLRGANIATAEEWASVGDPSRGGRGHYDGDGANHASISVAKTQAALQKARADYQRFTKAGMDPETARRSALLGIQEPHAPAQPPAQPPVADARPASPHPDAAPNPAAPRRVAARRTPAAPAPVRMASGGRVVGPGGPREDRVAAMLSAGEFVVHAAAAAKHPALLAALNNDQVPATSGRGGALPARFSDPAERPVPPRPAAAEGGSAGGAVGGAGQGGSPLHQHFYGQFDPAREARRSMLESNREIRRAQARALHSVGRRS